MRKSLAPAVIVAGLCIVTALSIPASLFSAAPEKEKKGAKKTTRDISEFMQEKLGASEKILEGLVTEDFELIQTGAKKLQELSEAEKWHVSKEMMYRQHSEDFNEIAKSLQKAAREENLDAAALSWIKATMSCIECHRYVRAVLVADIQ